jgi:hypothetical protein
MLLIRKISWVNDRLIVVNSDLKVVWIGEKVADY